LPPAGSSGTVSQVPIAVPITLDQLRDGRAPTGLIANEHFAPGTDATEAPPFAGTLRLAGTTMGVATDAPEAGSAAPSTARTRRTSPTWTCRSSPTAGSWCR
jgi:hypothetical protein